MSRLDQLYRSLLLTKFFTKGWGHPENLKRLFEFRKIISCRDKCRYLVSPDHPVFIDSDEEQKECRVIEGHFKSPFSIHLPDIMPEETETARFQMILPKVWRSNSIKPVCLHLAGTGDHYFWRRRTFMARPLLKEAGIASIILENPFYGVRKPKQQIRSSLQNVSDLFVMGGGLVLESLVLFNWCERLGYGPLGLTGVSMGGHGVMSGAIPWQLLQEQYLNNSSFQDEITRLVHSPEENYANVAFQLGRRFSRNYPVSVSNMEALQKRYFESSAAKDVAYEPVENNRAVSVNSPDGAVSYQTSFSSSSETSRSSSDNSHSTVDSGEIPEWLVKIGRSNSLASDSVLHFMRGIMDECTHIGNFSKPVDTSLVIVVAAKSDAYVPRTSVKGVDELWPGAEVRYIDSGHIAAYLFKQSVFRQAIIDAFDRQIKKYYM